MLAVSPEAEQDLLDIWLHIAQDNPVAADRFLDRLQASMSKLVQFPDMGIKRDAL